MVFWTAVHEMGHAFNLAHAWQKHLGTPWLPLTSDPEARSFMNYPYNVSGGVPAFFGSFRFRFTDQELLFLRHAPERFVQMGNANWFDNHGFQQADVSEQPMLRLQVRVNRDRGVFEYLEPVVLELKLTNIADEPQLIEDSLLKSLDHFTIIIKKDGREARQYQPFARYCWREKKAVLQPDESLFESIFVSAGTGGWDISEPGNYQVRLCLHHHDEDIVSNTLTLRVLHPRSQDEEVLAQDYFSDEVARVLAFDGSQYLESPNDTLRELSARFKDCRAAIHANIALGMPLLRPFKRIQFAANNTAAAGAGGSSGSVAASLADEKATEYILAALGETSQQASLSAESLGHVDYRYYAEHFTDALVQAGDRDAAVDNQKRLTNTLANRRVKGRRVAADVLRQVQERLQGLTESDEERPSERKRPRR